MPNIESLFDSEGCCVHLISGDNTVIRPICSQKNQKGEPEERNKIMATLSKCFVYVIQGNSEL